MEVSNLLNFLKSGVVDSHIYSIFGLALRPKGGAVVPMEIMVQVPLVPILSLEDGVEYFIIPMLIGMDIGMDMSMPVFLIQRGVPLVNPLPDVASAKISFTAGISSVCGANLLFRFVGIGNIETSPMVRQLNIFLSEIPLLLSVTVS